MVRITNRESAEAWLKTQPHQVQVWFATRCALRALPGLGYHPETTADRLDFLSLRATIISSAAASAIGNASSFEASDTTSNFTRAISRFAHFTSSHSIYESAAAHFAAHPDSVSKAADSTRSAVSTIHLAKATQSAANAAVTAAETAANSGSSDAGSPSRNAAYSAASWDANVPMQWAKLWGDIGQPDGLRLGWEALKRQWEEDAADWSFWVEWYERILNGDPMDWRLIFRIATEVTEEEWEAGPEFVAARIRDIQTDFLADTALPQAEKILFDPSSGKFAVEPIEIAKPDLLAATLAQVEDALEDALASLSNGLGEGSKVVRVVRRTIGKYGNNPQQIEMGFVSAHASLTRQMLVDELPNSEENLSLQSALEDAVVGLRATHPEIAENRKILNRQRFAEMTPEQGKVLEDALPVLRAISDDDLGDDWVNDIPELLNTSMGPLPTGAPALPGADVSTRIFSRAAKMSILMRTKAVVQRIDASTAMKAASIIVMLDALVALGIRLLLLIP